MKIAFLGDISLNDEYVQLYQEGARPFDEIGDYLKSFDYVIGNLECLAQGDKGENELKMPRLKTTVETLNYLTDIGVNVVELAHNHVYDNLKEGFEKTIAFLNSKNIQYLGASLNASQANKPLILEKDGISICLLNYVSKDTNPNLPEDAHVYVNWLYENRIISEIIQYKQKYNYVILLLHWGGRLEGGKYPDWDQPKIAKVFVDAGADLIVGNHSHTVQPYEMYKGKYIFYSLGNFCFANVIMDGKVINYMHAKRYRKSRIIIIDISNNELRVSFKNTIRNSDLHIKLYKGKAYFHQLVFKLLFSLRKFWYIYYFYQLKISPIYKFLFCYPIPLQLKLKRIYNKILNLQ